MRSGGQAVVAAGLALLISASASAQPIASSARSAAPADNGNWEMPGKNYASTRFSALRQITPANVAGLKPVFTFPTGIDKGHEAPPLVVGSMMYLVTPFPNYVYAIDLSAKPRPKIKWVFRPKSVPAAQGVACCDVVNRGAVHANGRLFFNTLDGQTFAIDANSGRQIWRVKLGDINKGETITMAPLVAGGKVLVGNSGGEMGVRGWLAAPW